MIDEDARLTIRRRQLAEALTAAMGVLVTPSDIASQLVTILRQHSDQLEDDLRMGRIQRNTYRLKGFRDAIAAAIAAATGGTFDAVIAQLRDPDTVWATV